MLEPVSGWKMGLADVKSWISGRDNSPTTTTQATTGVINLGAPGGQKSWGVRSSSGTVGGCVALSLSWFRDSRRWPSDLLLFLGHQICGHLLQCFQSSSLFPIFFPSLLSPHGRFPLMENVLCMTCFKCQAKQAGGYFSENLGARVCVCLCVHACVVGAAMCCYAVPWVDKSSICCLVPRAREQGCMRPPHSASRLPTLGFLVFGYGSFHTTWLVI